MPSGLGFPEVPERSGELHAQFLQPRDGVRALAEISLHQIRVHVVVGVVHVQVESVVHADVVELFLLNGGVNAKRPHAHVGRAARGTSLFQKNGTEAHFPHRDSRRKSGGTSRHDDNIRFQFFHVCTPFNPSVNPSQRQSPRTLSARNRFSTSLRRSEPGQPPPP